jgi:uncharacterized protein (TIGR02611 family)
MTARRPVAKLLERLVLPQLRTLLSADEELLAWSHVLTTDGRRGILMLTSFRCITHWPQRSDVVIQWRKVTGSRVDPGAPGELVLVLEAATGTVTVRLAAASHGQRRRAAQVLRTVGELTPSGVLDEVVGQSTAEFRIPRRGVRGHVRRVVVTTVGTLLLLLGVLFASPFVPGPGILTILAGLALLASEYDWARDLHHWLRNHFDRLRQRLRARRERRRAR